MASFSDPNVQNNASLPPASAYSALIAWGDGSSSVGQIESLGGLSGTFNIIGDHTYSQAGTYPMTVYVAGDGSSGQGEADANVYPNIVPGSIVQTGGPPGIVFGQTFHNMLITFQTNSSESQSLAAYSGVIDWGDGTTSAAQFVYPHGGAGHIQVWGTHLYAAPGAYSVNVQATGPDGSTISGPSAVVVNAAGIIADSPDVSTASLTFNGTVATFRYVGGDSNPHDFTATISWHDGSPDSTSLIVADGHGGFDVEATHTFAQYGPYNPEVEIDDNNNPYVGIADPILEIGGATLNATDISSAAGQPFTGTLATFAWPDASVPASQFYVSVDWGDDESDLDTVIPPKLVAEGHGVFSVVGTHVYGGAGSYDMEVSVLAPDGFTVPLLADSTATVGAGALTVTGSALSASASTSAGKSQSESASGIVATFTLPPGARSSSYSATIYWGDGNISAGQITALGDGTAAVRGSHTYAGLGTYQTTVQVTDASGDIAQARGTVVQSVPSSQVNPLPAVEDSPSFTVIWSGTDPGGPGIAYYDVYVSTDGGPFVLWQSHAMATSATYTGQAGQSYSFYSIATDFAGAVQPTPASGQATTQVVAPIVTLIGVQESMNRKRRVTQVIITFSGPVNAALADSTGTFHLATPGRRGSYSARNAGTIALESAAYDSPSNTVVLTPSKPFTLTKPVELVVYASGPDGLQDSFGRYVNGGTNAVAIISKRRAAIEAVRLTAMIPLIRGFTKIRHHVTRREPS
jgi:hypothetical protein